ncbi:helix-turn-helix domain-containing protein [Undibacterium sp. SXout7W]|uniref:AraC family transcriptional regulator n=1 Tax=Undibacterium sp. SXout7W TaxID=3413049 RepID=UPI003BF0498B
MTTVDKQRVSATVLSVQDAVFPAHPFSGVLAIAREQQWRVQEMFQAFAEHASSLPAQTGAAALACAHSEPDSRSAADSGQRISYVQARAGLLQARQQGVDGLALLSGARKFLPQLGQMEYGMRAQVSLGEALRFGLEYQLIAGSMVQLSLEQDGAQMALVAHGLFDDPELQDFLDADHLATALNAARQLCGQPLSLHKVELRGSCPGGRSMAEAFFGCPVVDRADVSRLVFSPAMLDIRLHHATSQAAAQADPDLILRARLACEQELAAVGVLGRQSLLRKLVTLQCEQHPVQDMATVLGMSPRTLHRLLAREGTSYANITENIRITRAKRLLQGSRSLDDIAVELGYSDSRSFRRAFRRWTHLSPGDYRLQMRSQPQ